MHHKTHALIQYFTNQPRQNYFNLTNTHIIEDT